MVSGIVLTSALRENLFSLKSTQNLIDVTQLRLATGLEVNSSLDNPQNFFSAKQLSNRANDFNILLDGISQSIRSVEVASNGVTSLTNLLEQADAIAQEASEVLAASENTARLVGNLDLRQESDLTSLVGIDDGDQFQILTTNDSGIQISEVITINSGDSVSSLTSRITNQFADNQNGEITATVTNSGAISIESSGGRTFRVIDESLGAGNEVGDAGFDSLGLGEYFEVEFHFIAPGVTSRSAATIVGGNTINTISLYEGNGDVVEAGDTLVGQTFQDAQGSDVISGLGVGSIIFFRTYSDDGVQFPTFTLTADTTFQDVVDSVNSNAAINQLVRAEFDSFTGQLNFTSLDDSLSAFEVGVFGLGDINFDVGLGDSTGNIDPITGIGLGLGFTVESRVFSFNTSNEELDSLAEDYDVIRQQIDDLVEDANYRGTNLLKGDDLTTFFNGDLTSSLVTNGVDFSANGLGLASGGFRTSSDVDQVKEQTRNAFAVVRQFGSTLTNNLSVIQTRRTFTEQISNTLSAGADDLIVADQNREGANLLALQTRQTLGVTSLSLAAQSQQAVLRIF